MKCRVNLTNTDACGCCGSTSLAYVRSVVFPYSLKGFILSQKEFKLCDVIKNI